ncbi:MAG TPA: hypothetical protein VK426_06405 [Methanobacterium sp.]|nr:hypothetical protein [Methanobacterium sp.]
MKKYFVIVVYEEEEKNRIDGKIYVAEFYVGYSIKGGYRWHKSDDTAW